MSEISKSPEKPRNALNKTLIAILTVAIPLLIYGLGYLVFPVIILSNYQNKNCDWALSLNTIYVNIYPAFVQDRSLPSHVEECEYYTRAVLNEQNGDWQTAYDDYQVYSKKYPNGLYTKDAYEHSAIVLMDLAKDQAERKSYGEALTNLNLIISSYPNSSVLSDVLTLAPSIYTSWGTDLREAQNFGEAERVFNDFKAWTQHNQKPELGTNALDGLGQTYLDWGLALQSQKQFEEALVKFDMAVSVGSQSPLNVAGQAKSEQRKLYMMWGNDMLERGEFPTAIEKFNLGVSKSDGNNEDGVNDALVNGYIEWAQKYSADEDFEGALEQLETAGQRTVSEAMKKSLEAAFGDTYLAYSKSSGIQARRAMKVAMITVCDKHKKPDLPIFGLNVDSIRFGIYDVDAQLPDDLAAQTPGEMHYIACVEEDGVTVSSRSHREILLRTSQGYYYRIIQQYRAQYIWNIELWKLNMFENVGEMTFTGGPPPPFSDTGTYFYGLPPEMTEVARWLETSTK